jgi:predicted Zn-dependent protease
MTHRPVLTREQMLALCQRIMGMTSADTAQVSVTHTARAVNRLANGRVSSSDDGDMLRIRTSTAFGGRWSTYVQTNQLDDDTLRSIIAQCEAIARESLGWTERPVPYQRQQQDTFVQTALWHDSTIDAMMSTRGTVIPDVLSAVAQRGFLAAGFLGFMARAESVITRDGCFAFSEETDCELTVTARGRDGKSSGWGGQTARDWTRIRPEEVVAHALDTAIKSANPVALEPGRRTAILSSAAVVQLVRFLGDAYDAFGTDVGRTPLSRSPHGNTLGQQLFDPRIDMSSDPNDPDGGYAPYFENGYATPKVAWVERGTLKNMAYDPSYAMLKGKFYAVRPWSIRISGGTTTVEEMIAQCSDGIYVNRFSGVELIDMRSGLASGVTRDGCFHIKDGKLSMAVKNFRFLESPFFMLNKIETLGVPERATFGYTPLGDSESTGAEWPRRPIIVPPMMVRDFNFASLADAV